MEPTASDTRRDFPDARHPPTMVTSWHRLLACRLSAMPLAAAQSRSRGPTKRVACARSEVPQHGRATGARGRLRPCPSARAARPARPRPRRARARASPRRSGSRPGCAACSSRAATLTASPVARRSSVPVTTSPVLTPMRACTPELGQRVAHLDRRAAGAQRVVLVHLRDAEHGHDRVADELLDRPAVRLDDPLHALEVAGEQRAAAPRGRSTRRGRSSR